MTTNPTSITDAGDAVLTVLDRLCAAQPAQGSVELSWKFDDATTTWPVCGRAVEGHVITWSVDGAPVAACMPIPTRDMSQAEIVIEVLKLWGLTGVDYQPYMLTLHPGPGGWPMIAPEDLERGVVVVNWRQVTR